MKHKLTPDDVRTIVESYQTSGNQNLMVPVIHHLDKMVRQQANLFTTPQGAVEEYDLIHVGQMAIITAADWYNIHSRMKFENYAHNFIFDAMREYYNRYSTPVTRPGRGGKNMYFDTLDANIFKGEAHLRHSEEFTHEEHLLTFQPDLEPQDYTYIHEAIATLSDVEQEVITLLYGFGCKPIPEKAIAGRKHTTIERIHGIRTRAERKLKIRVPQFKPQD